MNGRRGPSWQRWENSVHSVGLSRSLKPWRSRHHRGSIHDQGGTGRLSHSEGCGISCEWPPEGERAFPTPARRCRLPPHIARGPFSGEPGLEPLVWRQPSLLWVSLHFEQESKFAGHAFCPVCGVFSAGPEGCSGLPCAFRSYWVTSGQEDQLCEMPSDPT